MKKWEEKIKNAKNQKDFLEFDAKIRGEIEKIKTYNAQKANASAFLEKVKAETNAYLAEEKAAADKKAVEAAAQSLKDYDTGVTKAATLKKTLDAAQKTFEDKEKAYNAKKDDADLKKAWEEAELALAKASAASQK